MLGKESHSRLGKGEAHIFFGGEREKDLNALFIFLSLSSVLLVITNWIPSFSGINPATASAQHSTDLLFHTGNILSATQNRRLIDLFAHSRKLVSSIADGVRE